MNCLRRGTGDIGRLGRDLWNESYFCLNHQHHFWIVELNSIFQSVELNSSLSILLIKSDYKLYMYVIIGQFSENYRTYEIIIIISHSLLERVAFRSPHLYDLTSLSDDRGMRAFINSLDPDGSKILWILILLWN